MGKIIKLSGLNKQEDFTILGIPIYRKPTTIGDVFIDASKITKFFVTSPKESSDYYRSDYPTYTVIRLVGGAWEHVTETPEEIEKLMNGK